MEDMKVLYVPWDNLIVLDACRFDYFKKHCKIAGELTAVRSAGSNTGEWFSENFGGRRHDHVVYYSSNPWITDDLISEYWPGTKFHRLFEVLNRNKDQRRGILLQAAEPEEMVRLVSLTYPQFEDKRYVIHFFQPHSPYFAIRSNEHLALLGERVKEKKLKKSQVTNAYKKNLLWVLTHVTTLLSVLKGKTIITSDHGEMLGEKGQWGHGATLPDKDCDELRMVPWLEVTDRLATAKQQLEDLGYM